jgi:hypothetical protein
MPITMQCSKETIGAKRSDYPGESNSDKSPVYVHTFAEGCVLDIYERNGYNDSDFYAIYWDETSQSVKTIEYASTRGWTYANSAVVDATPEIQTKARQWEIERVIPQLIKNAEAEALEAQVGRICKVTGGRKIKIGSIVRVIRLGQPMKFSRWGSETINALVEVQEERFKNQIWTNIKNLETVNPKQYHISESQARITAVERVNASNWRSMPYIGASKALCRVLSRM